MSFLQSAGAGAAQNAAASGIGHLFGADPSRISMIADRFGNVANDIAAAGGAAQGYGGQAAQPNNYLQMLNNQKLPVNIGINPQALQYTGPSLQQAVANLPGLPEFAR